MLEGIGVVADVMVVIIGIGKEIPTCGEDIACTQVGEGGVSREGRVISNTCLGLYAMLRDSL